MPKTKRKSKKQQNREKRDFAETANAVFQQGMGIVRSDERLAAFLELERITHELALSALLGDDTH